MLVVASAFRNSEHYVRRYFEQVALLRDEIPLRLVLAEGDSTDDTYALIEKHLQPDDVLLKVDHGGPVYGSVNKPERWAQIAYVWNTILDHLHLDDTDRFLLVESDLGWAPGSIAELVGCLDRVGAVAAMSYHVGTGNFYDIWGHRGMDGERFKMKPPYHPDLDGLPRGRMVAIESAGSCIAVRGKVMNAGVRFSNEDGIRGFCRTIRDHATLWLHTGAEVWHP